MKAPDDAPTVGLLLCKSKNRVVAEYALRDTNKPMGVAEYQLVESLPKRLGGELAERRADRAGVGGGGGMRVTQEHAPKKIGAKLRALEAEIAEDLSELEGML